MMKRTLYILAMLFAVSISQSSIAAPGQPFNLATKSIVSSSSTSNPVWSASKAVDGSTGPTDGWLGEWGTSLAGGPWISFSLQSRSIISSIEVMQASLEQASKNRFSRPKKIIVDFVDGTDTKKLAFTLRDEESDMQPLKFAPLTADTVIIHIESVYPGETDAASTGFQEVSIIGNPSEGGAPVYKPLPVGGSDTTTVSKPKDYRPSTIAEPVPGEGWRTEDPGAQDEASAKSGSLSADEKEILNLLRELLARLEKKFMED